MAIRVTLMISVLAVACSGTNDSVRNEGRIPNGIIMLFEQARIDGTAADLVPIRSIVRLPSGYIAVSQAQDHRVRFFDSAGTPAASVGRAGRGPGEFTDITRLGVLGDTLWAHDMRQSRITLMTPAAGVIRTVVVPRQERPNNSTEPILSFLIPLAIYADSTFVAYGTNDAFDALVRVGYDGRRKGIILVLSTAREMRQVRSTSGVANALPFYSGPFHAASPNGEFFAALRTNFGNGDDGEYSLTILNAAGDTVRSTAYRFSGTRIPSGVVDSVIAAATAQLPPDLAAEYRDNALIPPVFPPVAGLVLADDGSAWIQMREPGQYLAVAANGVPLGLAEFPARTKVVYALADEVWVLEADLNDVQSIVRYQTSAAEPRAERGSKE